MKLYSAKVRLKGSPLNEVVRDDLTAPEIILLRAVHGGADAVVGIVCTGEKQVSHEEERDRLRGLYNTFQDEGRNMVDVLFGPEFQPLPLRVPGIPDDAPPEAELAPVVRVPRQPRSSRPSGAGAVPAENDVMA